MGPQAAAWALALGLLATLWAYSLTKTITAWPPSVPVEAGVPASSLPNSETIRTREAWEADGVLPGRVAESDGAGSAGGRQAVNPLHDDWAEDPDAAWGLGP